MVQKRNYILSSLIFVFQTENFTLLSKIYFQLFLVGNHLKSYFEEIFQAFSLCFEAENLSELFRRLSVVCFKIPDAGGQCSDYLIRFKNISSNHFKILLVCLVTSLVWGNGAMKQKFIDHLIIKSNKRSFILKS